VITALHGSEKIIKERIILCFPEDSRMALVAKVKTQKPTPEQIKECRKKITHAFQKLASEGKVDLRDIAQDYEAQRGDRHYGRDEKALVS
jgi:ribosome recycling factor